MLLEEAVLSPPKNRPGAAARIFAVASGKGGVGKSWFSVNMAVSLASRNWRVILVDADLTCSNIETILGVHCETCLDEFFHTRGPKNLTTLLHNTQYENLTFIPGTTGLLSVANPKFQQKTALCRELKRLDADIVILDLDAGAHLNTLDLFLLDDARGILVINPERTSIENTYKFLRAALFRRIERFYQSAEVAQLLSRDRSLPSFTQSIMRSGVLDESEARQICHECQALARSFSPRLVVNKAANWYEAQIAATILKKRVRNELLMNIEMLGFIPFDARVPEGVNSSVPFIVKYPKHRIAGYLAEMTERLGFSEC